VRARRRRSGARGSRSRADGVAAPFDSRGRVTTDRYARYEALRELGLEARGVGEYDLAAALLELARLVLLEREKDAAAALRTLPVKG
jgi:hypothetical protein